ncbi:site-specific integrase [Lactobacillus kullabergensis]|uniref:tyrosine-type recombinase/integrase n=1 Tax=Lactobacillus TaxID=1578 RepID=UPI0022462375|nr:tyrosine-type recombinase/integrase [Lactobacillus kullabergensis]MCT6888429.1 site-specific integrase [Lactobacillus sp.]MCX0291550.1 site-specific integrase [Lactobacillus kullabergensis]
MIKKINDGKHKGEWLVRIQPRDKATGKKKPWPRKYVASKREAVLAEKQMWIDYENGLSVGTGKAIFAEEFQKYVNKRASTISPVTLNSWQSSANAFKQYFGNAKVNQITTAMVSQYAHDYVKKHHATVSKSSTIAKRLIHMRNFFKSIEGKTIKGNPVPEAPLKVFFRQSDFSVAKEWYIFTANELDQIRNLIFSDLKHSSVQNWSSKLAILIESYTGMRVGELQALKFKNIIFEDNVWTFRINNSWSDLTKDFTGALKARPQGYSRAVVPVPERLIQLLKAYQTKQTDFLHEHDCDNPLGLVFMNLHDYKSAANNMPINQHSINDMLKVICKRLEITSNNKLLSVYSFRHTICTSLANTPKMSYPWAAERMGHSLQMFMKTYVGVDPDMNKQMNAIWANKQEPKMAPDKRLKVV